MNEKVIRLSEERKRERDREKNEIEEIFLKM